VTAIIFASILVILFSTWFVRFGNGFASKADAIGVCGVMLLGSGFVAFIVSTFYTITALEITSDDRSLTKSIQPHSDGSYLDRSIKGDYGYEYYSFYTKGGSGEIVLNDIRTANSRVFEIDEDESPEVEMHCDYMGEERFPFRTWPIPVFGKEGYNYTNCDSADFYVPEYEGRN
jgi:hypothetical protein